MSDYSSIVRLIVCAIALLAAAFLAVRINDDWARMSPGWRLTRLMNLGILLTVAYALIEVMLIEPPVPLGARIYLFFFMFIGLIVGLYLVRNETTAHGGWIEASEIQDILDEVESAHAIACNPPAPGCLIARDRMKEKIKDARKTVNASM